MKNVSSIHELYAYEDGDTITSGMGVAIDSGYGLSQYFDTATGKVVNTDFTKHPPTLFPQAYSTKRGALIVPDTVQWYYNNMNSDSAILGDDGNVKAAFSTLFQKTTVVMDGVTFPALKIIGNLATPTDYTDKYIYFSGTFSSKSFICSQLIPIQASVGNSYKVILSWEGESGAGDATLSNDNDWVKVTAKLQQAGTDVTSGVVYKFQKYDNASEQWTELSSLDGMVEVSGNVIKIYAPFVDGVDAFRAVAVYLTQGYVTPFSISDVHDPFVIYDGCSIDGDAVEANIDVTFTPQVYNRKTAKADDTHTWSFVYSVFRRSDNQLLTQKVGASATVKYDLIADNGGVRVRILATGEAG